MAKRGKKWNVAKHVERASLLSMTLSLLSLMNARFSFPSYNLILAMWGLFCVYNRSTRAVFVLIAFLGVRAPTPPPRPPRRLPPLRAGSALAAPTPPAAGRRCLPPPRPASATSLRDQHRRHQQPPLTALLHLRTQVSFVTDIVFMSMWSQGRSVALTTTVTAAATATATGRRRHRRRRRRTNPIHH